MTVLEGLECGQKAGSGGRELGCGGGRECSSGKKVGIGVGGESTSTSSLNRAPSACDRPLRGRGCPLGSKRLSLHLLVPAARIATKNRNRLQKMAERVDHDEAAAKKVCVYAPPRAESMHRLLVGALFMSLSLTSTVLFSLRVLASSALAHSPNPFSSSPSWLEPRSEGNILQA